MQKLRFFIGIILLLDPSIFEFMNPLFLCNSQIHFLIAFAFIFLINRLVMEYIYL